MVKTLSEIQLRKIKLLERLKRKHKVVEFLGITEVDERYVAWFNYEKPCTKGLTTGIMREEIENES